MIDEFELLMVGGGPAGLAAARAYRAAGGRGAVAIVADEHRVPYNRPPLTKELLRGESSEDELPIEPEAWSNVPALAEHYFAQVDGDVCDRAMKLRDGSGHLIVGGENYGQGSSREHGALIPAFLGLRAAIAKSFARIHGQNLVNFGVVPLLFCDPGDHDAITPDTVLRIDDVHDAIRACEPFDVHLGDSDESVRVRHDLSPRQINVVLAGGLINAFQSHNSTGGEPMPPRGVKKGTKRARQYERIKESQLDRGTGERRAEEIAARTVNKERARSGESESRSASSTRDMSSSRRGGLRSGTNRTKGRTRDQLYSEARKMGIEGRSNMNKAQLQRAVDSRKK
jgi:hypothetical protein